MFPQPLAMVTARGTKIKSTSHRKTVNKINQQSFSSLVLIFLLGLSLLNSVNQINYQCPHKNAKSSILKKMKANPRRLKKPINPKRRDN